MRFHYHIRLMVFVLLLIGCSPATNEPTIALSITLNPTRFQATIPPIPATGTSIPPFATSTPTMVVRDIPTPTITVTPIIAETCQEPILVEKTELASGLILRGSWNGQVGFAMLGNEEIGEPMAYYLDVPGWLVSPDGEWVAGIDLEVIDADKNINTAEISVHDWSNEHIYSNTLFNIALGEGIPFLFWTRDLKLVLSLRLENDMVRWWVWDPIHEQEPYLIEVNLNQDNNMVQSDTQLRLDPLLEYVIYKCDDCSELEYWVSSLETGDIVWKITAEEGKLLDILAVPSWSLDGQFLALMVAEKKGTTVNQTMRIFNRQGEKIYELDMPANERGIYGGGILSWSPDGQYLAFSRNNLATPSTSKTTLGYLSLINGNFTDLCLNVPGAFPTWSFDSTRLALGMQVEAGLPARTIFIADIVSGITVQMFSPEGYDIAGWRNLSEVNP